MQREYDTITTQNLALRNGVISALATLGAASMTWQMFTSNSKEAKAMYATLGLGASVAGMLAGSSTRELLDIRETYHDIARIARANHVYSQYTNQILPPKNYPIFDWVQFKTKPDKYPHALILGATGGGKSTLAENLAGLMRPSRVIGVVPHWQQGDFGACDRVVAIERNVGDGFDNDPTTNAPLYSWADIQAMPAKTPVSACELLHALYWEMHRRYSLDASGRFIGGTDEELVIILDEFLLYAKLPGMSTLWKKLVREARKVRIRLILLVQGDSVAALGIEGEGDIRESLTYIYLREFAIQHADQCYNRVSSDKQPYYAWVKEQFTHQRPCMVEDELAQLPQPGQYGTNLQSSTKTTALQTTHANYILNACNGTEASVPSVVRHTDREVQTSVSYSQPESDDFLEGYEAVTASLTPNQLESSLKGLWDTARDAATQNMPSGNPYTREAIIKKVWGYESSQYKIGKVLWVLCQDRYGKIPLKEY